MNRFYLLAIIMSCTLFSCSQDTCINDVSDIQNLNLSRASLPEMKVLEFENQDDFENAVSQAHVILILLSLMSNSFLYTTNMMKLGK